MKKKLPIQIGIFTSEEACAILAGIDVLLDQWGATSNPREGRLLLESARRKLIAMHEKAKVEYSALKTNSK